MALRACVMELLNAHTSRAFYAVYDMLLQFRFVRTSFLNVGMTIGLFFALTDAKILVEKDPAEVMRMSRAERMLYIVSMLWPNALLLLMTTASGFALYTCRPRRRQRQMWNDILEAILQDNQNRQ